MIKLNGVKIIPTIFPDKTSQVWKLSRDVLDDVEKRNFARVEWDFENEAEFMHLAQLKTLLDVYTDSVYLDVPYMPYARQDKRVSNESTFALYAFAKLLNALGFCAVYAYDFHNPSRAHVIKNLAEPQVRRLPDIINDVIGKVKPDAILFPDEGASTRGAINRFRHIPCVTANKKRNQSTGRISNVRIPENITGKMVLIIDDICDGGMTFKLVAEAALQKGAREVHLYVTHGIFSKGIRTLRDSGIRRIFTHKGEVK